MTETRPPTSTMVLVDSVLVEPPRTIDEEEPFPTLPPATPTALAAPGEPTDLGADDQPKRKGRPRLMRGLSRMSSFPNLAQFGRNRASSTPYDRSGAAMSCSSLAPSSSALTTPSSVANSIGSALTSPIASHPDEQFSSLPMAASLSSPGTRMASNVYGGNGDGTFVRKVVSAPLSPARPKRSFVALWATLPREVKIHIFSHLGLKELVRLSRVNREFYAICFDGQLWASFDTSEFYRDIPATSLSRIATTAGPFVKDLNLRGCIQIEKFEDALVLSAACQNLVSACLEGSHINTHNLRTILRKNAKLVNINLSGLNSVDQTTCLTISEYCPQLEILNLSWCKNLKAKDLNPIIRSCTKLRDLRIGELRGIDADLSFANALFETNRLERLILSGSLLVTNAVLTALMRGPTPETGHQANNRPAVPPRRLRHLDLGHCRRLTQAGLLSMGHCVPDLEGLVLSGCPAVTNAGLIPILASCPKLTHLELEDLTELTNALLTDHLAKAPCAESMKHLSLSYCEKIGDAGVLPVLRACKSLRSLDLDNTQVSDLVLAEAVAVVSARSSRTCNRATRPRPSLSLTVYDCPNITWTGVREVLSRNAELVMPPRAVDSGEASLLTLATYPTEIITLKCFYGWQMTVDEHTKRVLRGDFASAARLEHKWGIYMQANEEAGMPGAGGRRRRRRAREAQQVHANEELGGLAPGDPGLALMPRRRARTASCAVM